jgi:hypothetical protein
MSGNSQEITHKNITKFSFGNLEYLGKNIFVVAINEDIIVNNEHIEEFSNIIRERELEKYGIFLKVSNPHFCSEEIATQFSRDKKLVAIAILIDHADKLRRSKFMLELTSLLPNPFQVPVKFFKKSNVAEEWLEKHLTKK